MPLKHTSYHPPEMRKTGTTRLVICFANKNTRFVSGVLKVVLQKKQKIKLDKRLASGLLPAMKEWAAREGITLKRHIMLSTFSLLLPFRLTCTAPWRSRRSKLASRSVQCLRLVLSVNFFCFGLPTLLLLGLRLLGGFAKLFVPLIKSAMLTPLMPWASSRGHRWDRILEG